jgi:hypothetical protein
VRGIVECQDHARWQACDFGEVADFRAEPTEILYTRRPALGGVDNVLQNIEGGCDFIVV